MTSVCALSCLTPGKDFDVLQAKKIQFIVAAHFFAGKMGYEFVLLTPTSAGIDWINSFITYKNKF